MDHSITGGGAARHQAVTHQPQHDSSYSSPYARNSVQQQHVQQTEYLPRSQYVAEPYGTQNRSPSITSPPRRYRQHLYGGSATGPPTFAERYGTAFAPPIHHGSVGNGYEALHAETQVPVAPQSQHMPYAASKRVNTPTIARDPATEQRNNAQLVPQQVQAPHGELRHDGHAFETNPQSAQWPWSEQFQGVPWKTDEHGLWSQAPQPPGTSPNTPNSSNFINNIETDPMAPKSLDNARKVSAMRSTAAGNMPNSQPPNASYGSYRQQIAAQPPGNSANSDFMPAGYQQHLIQLQQQQLQQQQQQQRQQQQQQQQAAPRQTPPHIGASRQTAAPARHTDTMHNVPATYQQHSLHRAPYHQESAYQQTLHGRIVPTPQHSFPLATTPSSAGRGVNESNRRNLRTMGISRETAITLEDDESVSPTRNYSPSRNSPMSGMHAPRPPSRSLIDIRNPSSAGLSSRAQDSQVSGSSVQPRTAPDSGPGPGLVPRPLSAHRYSTAMPTSGGGSQAIHPQHTSSALIGPPVSRKNTGVLAPGNSSAPSTSVPTQNPHAQPRQPAVRGPLPAQGVSNAIDTCFVTSNHPNIPPIYASPTSARPITPTNVQDSKSTPTLPASAPNVPALTPKFPASTPTLPVSTPTFSASTPAQVHRPRVPGVAPYIEQHTPILTPKSTPDLRAQLKSLTEAPSPIPQPSNPFEVELANVPNRIMHKIRLDMANMPENTDIGQWDRWASPAEIAIAKEQILGQISSNIAWVKAATENTNGSLIADCGLKESIMDAYCHGYIRKEMFGDLSVYRLKKPIVASPEVTQKRKLDGDDEQVNSHAAKKQVTAGGASVAEAETPAAATLKQAKSIEQEESEHRVSNADRYNKMVDSMSEAEFAAYVKECNDREYENRKWSEWKRACEQENRWPPVEDSIRKEVKRRMAIGFFDRQ